MDLLAMHGNKVDAPLNISPHNLLFLLKEATSLTIILSPTVKHSLTEIIDKINGTAPPEESRQRDTTNLSTQVALQATAAAAADTLANELTAAKATVTCLRTLLMRSLYRHKLLPRKQHVLANKQVWLSSKLDVQNLPLLIQSKLLKLMSRLKLQKSTSARWTKQQPRRVTLHMARTPLTTEPARNTKWWLKR